MNSQSAPSIALREPHPRGYAIGDYMVEKVIAETLGSSVYLCHKRGDKSGAVKYAVKSCRWPVIKRDALGYFGGKLKLKAIKSLNHPNVVKTRDLIEHGGGRYWIMDYVDGVSLASLVKKGIPFPEADIVKLTRGLSAAFRYIAESRGGFLIKTELLLRHIIVRTDGSPCVIDIEPRGFRSEAEHVRAWGDTRRAVARRDYIGFLGKCALRMALAPTPIPPTYRTDKARLGELKRRALAGGYDEDLVGLAVASVADPDAVAFADWERILA